MGIKFKNRTPKTTDFQKNEIVIDGNKGSLFFKTNNNELKELIPGGSTDPNVAINTSNISTNTSNISSISSSLASNIATLNVTSSKQLVMHSFNFNVSNGSRHDMQFIPWGGSTAEAEHPNYITC